MKMKALQGRVTTLNTAPYQEEFDLLVRALPNDLLDNFSDPVAYNDCSWVDHKSVLSVLDRAIAYAKDKEKPCP